MAVCWDRGTVPISTSPMSARAVTRIGGAREICSPPASTPIPIPTGDPIGRASRIDAGRDGRPRSAPAPGDGRPDAFVKVIPADFGYDLEGSNRTRDLDPARHEPADRKCVERSQRPPTDGLKHRPGV